MAAKAAARHRGALSGAIAAILLVLPGLANAQILASPVDGSDPASQRGSAAAAARTTEPPPVPAGPAYQPATIATPDPPSRRDQQEESEPAPMLARTTAPSEFETYVSNVAGKPLRRFGADLLIPGARGFTAPPTTTVPPGYRINPGDELVVGITGSLQANGLRLVVDPEGRVFLPRVGAITVGGVRYGEVQALIERQVARFYRDFDLSVAIGRLHGITVYVTGFAATPGSYTLGSLSTLVNAVLAAGGPSAGGSFRSIQLRRGGRLLSDFDLYDLVLRGDNGGDVVLQNGDVLYIAPVGAQVAVLGSVNQEAIYEAGPGDTLSDVLLFAGGVNTVADNSRLLVLDSLAVGQGGWEELSPEKAAARTARRGEILRVLSAVGIARPLAQQPVLVLVSGEVARPGRYYFQPGARIADLVERAGGLTAEAFPYASVVTRDSVRQQQRTSFARAVADLELQLTAQPLVSANRSERLQPANLEAVRSVIAQYRSREPDGRLVLDIAPGATSLPGALILENNDTIQIPPRPVTVGVFGAVANPASFAFTDRLTIGDYVGNAGGVSNLGDKSGVFVVRANGSVLAGGRRILKQPALPGDLVYVPIDADRGEFWARLRDITGSLFGGLVAAASVKAITD